jgi:ribosomal protein L11 methyltransferase
MLALVVSVPATEAELAADALWALGVVAIEERDGGVSTDDQLVELWTSLGDDADTIAKAAEAFPARWRWRLAEIDESVAHTWRAHAVPTWISRDLVVCPAWVDVRAPASTTIIRIDPGATFGLGDHPTTMLSLRALRTSMFSGARVLDVGCGSGVLSIAAAVFGAVAVDAIDISATAAQITMDNARLNDVDAMIDATTTPLAELDGPYDLVVANILAPALVDLAPDLRRVLGPSGVLIVSGLLAERHSHVEDALSPLHLVETDTREGWAALTFRH